MGRRIRRQWLRLAGTLQIAGQLVARGKFAQQRQVTLARLAIMPQQHQGAVIRLTEFNMAQIPKRFQLVTE